VTAPPGTLNEVSNDPEGPPEEPSTAAFGLLSRAQAIADRLRAEVEAEVAALRADANASHDEARRLLSDATVVHEDALSAQRSAQARLEEAHEEAAQLVADAADQATLVADAAARTSESLVASTQAEADGIRSKAQEESLRLRGLATSELVQVRESNAALQAETAARLESHQSQVNAELQRLGEEASRRASTILAEAKESAQSAISRADTEADEARVATNQELAGARAETIELRATAAIEIASARDEATAEADRVLGDAADHMHWAQDTVRSLLSTAEAEADRARLSSHARDAAHLTARRRQLQDVIARVALRARTAVAEAAAEAERLRAQASAVLEAADKDTIATREHARAHADRVISEADLTAQAALERAQRRLDEAEGGARVLRERAAAEVARLQTEAHQHRREVREEATATLAAARADADTSRAEARDLLILARAEVAVLAQRRDDITEQLGHLSGVIEALAVSEHAEAVAGLSAAVADIPEPIPQNQHPNPQPTTEATTGTR
jgi:hypothetical protein